MSEHRLKVSIEDCIAVRTTAKAVLVLIGDGPKSGEQVWIPQSQIDDDSEVYNEESSGTLVISEWIATEKGLI